MTISAVTAVCQHINVPARAYEVEHCTLFSYISILYFVFIHLDPVGLGASDRNKRHIVVDARQTLDDRQMQPRTFLLEVNCSTDAIPVPGAGPMRSYSFFKTHTYIDPGDDALYRTSTTFTVHTLTNQLATLSACMQFDFSPLT